MVIYIFFCNRNGNKFSQCIPLYLNCDLRIRDFLGPHDWQQCIFSATSDPV